MAHPFTIIGASATHPFRGHCAGLASLTVVVHISTPCLQQTLPARTRSASDIFNGFVKASDGSAGAASRTRYRARP